MAAPYFEQVAKEILLRLQGKLFVAHNVRFDYGFIRNEFARLAYSFKSKLMCTVKLSRFLYADREGHSLEKIITRHQIYVTHRHRALDDAKATYKFMIIAEEEKGEELIKDAIQHQYRKESMPANFDAHLIEALPNSPGVYYFWGENKELQPIYNRKLRRVSTFYSIQLEEAADGILKPQICAISEMPLTKQKLYGLFASEKKAKQAIQSICGENNLCYHVCGLEKHTGRACSGHQLKKCKGYCVGKQLAIQHNVKLLEGLGALALKTWPYKSPVSIIEEDASGQQKHLIVDNWCVLGIAGSSNEISEVLSQKSYPQIDRDTYRYLVDTIFSKDPDVVIRPVFPSSNEDSHYIP